MARSTSKSNKPVVRVSWLDIYEGDYRTEKPSFLSQLNSGKNILKYYDYDLPSEAMWQFAAKGGNLSSGYKYAGSNHLNEIGWYHKNSYGETKPVKLKFPNELGFYDMSGNIFEWCADKWTAQLSTLSSNGLPNEVGDDDKRDLRVVRGGSWYDTDNLCLVTNRIRFDSFSRNGLTGFRLFRY